MDSLRRYTALRRVAFFALAVLLVSLLAACSSINLSQTATTAPVAIVTAVSTTAQAPTAAPATSAPTSALAPTEAAAATTAPTSAPEPTAAPTDASAAAATSAPAANADSAVVNAIKKVIEQANHEQEQAVAANDATLMRDTSTASYYTQAAQGLSDLQSAGVTSIKLVKLDWGAIAVQGPTAAQATTVETWSTSFADNSTTQEADTNVYSMVLENGGWKVQDDQHPDAQRLQPSPDTPGTTPGAAPAPVSPATPGDAGQSRNWAGYAATGSNFTAVSGSWTVPTIAASRIPAADATWVGIGGISSHDLIQAGTDASVQGGQVEYSAWIEMLPQASQPIPLEVSAGDKVSVSITQQSNNTWQIHILNQTTGKSYQKTVTYTSSQSSAEWIEEAPVAGRRTLLPLDNFGTIGFNSATAVEDGQQRSISQAGGQAISMFDRTGQPIAQPSALGKDGSSFSVTRSGTTSPRLVPQNTSALGQTL